jgi:membrane protease subunit HflC
MKSAAITILVLLIMVVLGFMLFSFQVRQIESALLTTFGEPKRQITEPGLYFRWPAPIQNVHKFDSRQRVFEADIGETTTKEATPVIVNTYVVWRIARPLDFFNSVGTVKEAESKLLSQISDTQNKVIGRHSFSEFVNSDPDKIKFRQIEDEMLEVIKAPVAENYGIEITHLGIKQLKISEDVSKNVFDRMRSEREQRVSAIISEGNAEATKIKSDADSKKEQLLIAAEARAKAIRGAGDAEAAKYYKQLEEDPELAMFLRDIEALKKILEKRSTVVLSGDTEPFRLLKSMPDIGPRK